MKLFNYIYLKNKYNSLKTAYNTNIAEFSEMYQELVNYNNLLRKELDNLKKEVIELKVDNKSKKRVK